MSPAPEKDGLRHLHEGLTLNDTIKTFNDLN